MRILQVHNAYRQRGGEDAVAEAEAALLSAAGHEVHRLVVPNPEGAGAAARRLAVAAWNPASSRLVRTAIADFRPDVAHVHNTWYSLSAAAVAALHREGVPLVMTLHNYRYTCLNGQLLRNGRVCELCVGRTPLPGVRYGCYRDSVPASAMAVTGVMAARATWPRHVDRFITMTGFGRELFTASGLPGDRIVVKPHFVADPGLRDTPPSRSKTVVFIGRLATEKGVDLLVEAWRRTTLPDYELVIIGDGPLRDPLSAILPENARLIGWQPPAQARRLLLDARLLAFPSIWYETFGLSLVEAMAAATPILASDLGGTPEILGDTLAHGLVTPGEVDHWAARLQRTVPDDSWVDIAGAAARRRYEERYTPALGLLALEDIYDSVRRELR